MGLIPKPPENDPDSLCLTQTEFKKGVIAQLGVDKMGEIARVE
jgi:hypothetical protein